MIYIFDHIRALEFVVSENKDWWSRWKNCSEESWEQVCFQNSSILSIFPFLSIHLVLRSFIAIIAIHPKNKIQENANADCLFLFMRKFSRDVTKLLSVSKYSLLINSAVMKKKLNIEDSNKFLAYILHVKFIVVYWRQYEWIFDIDQISLWDRFRKEK